MGKNLDFLVKLDFSLFKDQYIVFGMLILPAENDRLDKLLLGLMSSDMDSDLANFIGACLMQSSANDIAGEPKVSLEFAEQST